MSSIWTLRRSATDRKVAGLCGGVAAHWRVDPVLVRVAWVLLALSGGIGVVLYVAGWLLVPVQGAARAPAEDLIGESVRKWPREAWVAIVVVACLASFAAFGRSTPIGVGPAVVMACIWYFGFAKHGPRGGATDPAAGQQDTGPAGGAPPPVPVFVEHAGPVTPFTAAAQTWRARIEEHGQQAARSAAAGLAGAPAPVAGQPTWPLAPGASATPGSAAGAEPDPARAAFLAEPDPVGLYQPEPTPPPGPLLPRRRSLSARRLRLVSLVALGLTLAGLGFADRQGVAVPAAGYASAALLVVGLTLLAAVWLGRARGLLPLGLLLVPVVVVTAAVGPALHLDQWDMTPRSYRSVAELPPAGDSRTAGELTVDLSQLDLDADATYTAHVGTGRLEVVVPPEANVALRYRVGAGVVEAYGSKVSGGSNLAQTLAPAPLLGQQPTLTLDLSVDRGELEVRR